MVNDREGVGGLNRELLDHIEAKRAEMPPEARAELEREELDAQRESWLRAMAPCEHGVADFEDCADCRHPKPIGEPQ